MSPTPQALQWVCALHRIMCKGLIPEGLLLGALSNRATMLCSLCPVSWHSWLLLHALQVTNDHGLPEWDAGTTTLKQGHYSPLHRAAAHGISYSSLGVPHEGNAASGAKADDPQQKHNVMAVVPPGALEIIVRTMYSEQALLQTAQRIKLLKQYEVLRELGFTGGLRMNICGTFHVRFAFIEPWVRVWTTL